MNRNILSSDQIHDLVFANKYPVDSSQRLLSRCIEGGYQGDKTIPALSIAGADAGDLAVLYATASMYGFEIDTDRAYKTFFDIIGGPKNFSFHTTSASSEKLPAAGCIHLKQIRADGEAYTLEADQTELINTQIAEAQKKGAQETILKSINQEGAVLQIQGDWGVYPQFHLETSEGRVPVSIFTFHKTLTDDRHRLLAKKLIENKAVSLFKDLDDEYLYQVLSSTTEDHFFETIKRVARNLPIFDVIFKKDGTYTLEERGKI